MKNEMVSDVIAEAYERDRAKPEVQVVIQIARESRKFGFPLVCTLSSSAENERLQWAARLLLSQGETWPLADIPADWLPALGSAIYQDARQLLENAIGNTSQLSI